VQGLPTLDDLSALSESDLDRDLIHGLERVLLDLLHVDVRSEFPDRGEFLAARFTAMGIDSLTTQRLRDTLRRWLRVEVPPEMVMGGSSVQEVVDLIHGRLMLKRLSAGPASGQREMESSQVWVL
jgi:acyl carrier protein